MLRRFLMSVSVAMPLVFQSVPALADPIPADILLWEIAERGCKINVDEMFTVAEDLGVGPFEAILSYLHWLIAEGKATSSEEGFVEYLTLTSDVCQEISSFENVSSINRPPNDAWASLSGDAREAIVERTFTDYGCHIEVFDFSFFFFVLKSNFLFEVGLLPAAQDVVSNDDQALSAFVSDYVSQMKEDGKINSEDVNRMYLTDC